MLDRYNLPNGLIFKSESGELSNLRWDLPLPEMPSYYSRANRKQYTWEWGLLANLTRGLAGGGPGTRCVWMRAGCGDLEVALALVRLAPLTLHVSA